MNNENNSIVPRIHKKFGFHLTDIKVPFAEAVADIINWSPWNNWAWWNDDEFIETELGSFLEFIRRVH